MENLNINRDKPEITDEQILKHRNFDAVMSTVAATKLPWYKMGKFWLVGVSAVVAVTVTTVLLINNKSGEENVEIKKISIVENESISIVEESDKEDKNVKEKSFRMFSVTPQTKEVFTLLGLEIEVPREVIVDENGDGSNVYDVQITQLDMPEDIEYSSHSKKEVFQIDLLKNGEPVELYGADAILIKNENIDILSFVDGNWDSMEKYKYNKQIISYDSSSMLLKPVQNTKRPFVFEEKYGIKEKIQGFIEIANYDNVVFQPFVEQKESFYTAEWDDVLIEQVEPGRYKLNLKMFDLENVCYAEVVFREKDIVRAQEKYNASFQKTEKITETESQFFALQNGGKYIVLYP